jgi:hypothetical protein
MVDFASTVITFAMAGYSFRPSPPAKRRRQINASRGISGLLATAKKNLDFGTDRAD